MLVQKDIHFKVFIDYEDDWIFNIESLIYAGKIGISSKGYYCWVIRDASESHRYKYIPDLLSKRKKWMKWMSEIVDQLGATPERIGAFKRDVLIPRNIMMCFNNACWYDGADKGVKIQEIEEAISPEGWNIADVDLRSVKEMSPSNKYLLSLLKKKKVSTAYWYNSLFFRNRFH